ncbi:hypothetical protein [Bythopirellula goksoeyrii]|uniref:Outer membrane protein beta-barrel domain-containing protein n=1 Tax=Bythopirellula goksoeyrii TaxID=1400387 RepID=A0A5B9QB84_9BACT|nr:hypothetical protein [Bythopirellula goksoeyrii]QEG34772.1 hypothetical protein Pr1d_20560 [Bythopirellula goksoeyrii]
MPTLIRRIEQRASALRLLLAVVRQHLFAPLGTGNSVDTSWPNCHTPRLFSPFEGGNSRFISSPSDSNLIRMAANTAHIWSRLCTCYAITALLVLAMLMPRSSHAAEPFDDVVLEGTQESEVLSSDAAKFDEWESLFDDDKVSENEIYEDSTASWGDPNIKTIDWLRHFGFRHSSSSGRFAHKGVPLEGTSWLNRPYHADWFVGSLLGDELIPGRVDQHNGTIGGVRIGTDFDYYWGAEWRFGWSHPNIGLADQLEPAASSSYFITDVDLKYYPWGDTVVRPYWLLGLGMTNIGFRDHEGVTRDVTLATMPIGTGVTFHQWPWLVWRLEVLDNISFGADGVQTVNNFSLTAGMEYRFGAKPQSYWPWRTSRRIW